MKIVHVITGMQKAAGTTTFVENVVRELRVCGHDVEVVTNCDRLSALPFGRPDLLHIHGLWSPMLHRVAKWSRCNDIPIVWSPHGMLQKWALKNKLWKKLLGLLVYQWWDLRSAALLHATAQSEVEDIRRLGLTNKVVVAPLGVNLPLPNNRMFKQSSGAKTLLFVSRIQKKKGLPNLIEAWSRLPQDLRQRWQVRIVGPDQDNHTAELKRLCEGFGIRCEGLGAEVTFVGPKYDADLSAEYDNADLFVLPTHSENFGSVVIEALAHGVPVITTKEAPWAEIETFQCGWWIDDSLEALTTTLRNVFEQSNKQHNQAILQEMGRRGRKLVEERYTWPAVCDKMVRGYEEVSQ